MLKDIDLLVKIALLSVLNINSKKVCRDVVRAGNIDRECQINPLDYVCNIKIIIAFKLIIISQISLYNFQQVFLNQDFCCLLSAKICNVSFL